MLYMDAGSTSNTLPIQMEVIVNNSSTDVSEQSQINHKKYVRMKLKDHKTPLEGRVKRLSVVRAHKRVLLRRLVRHHHRHVHDLYCLMHSPDNFLECPNFVHMNNEEKPKELLMMLDEYRLPSISLVLPQISLDITVEPPAPVEPPTVTISPETSPVKQTPITPEHSYEKIPPKTPESCAEKIPPKTPESCAEKIPPKTPETCLEKIPLKMPDKSPTKPISNNYNRQLKPKRFSEKLKAEAAVVQRVAELQKDGMWYDKRLPKSHDQPRLKSHWDYLLEEMQWLAVDFAVEKKWKRIAARKCARMVEKYFAEKKLAEEKAKKDEKVKVQKIAAFMAKEVRNFWSNVRKLVEYKELWKIEELRKKTMDQRLSFIVDQTEKISSMLAESFATEVKPHQIALENELSSSGNSDALKIWDDGVASNMYPSDDEFLPSVESEDDEGTIATAEGKVKDVRREVDLLQKESEMSIDAILDELPMGYVQHILDHGKPTQAQGKNLEPEPDAHETDYEPSGSESDLEDTIVEEERIAGKGPSDSAAEIKELEEDNMLSLEQLRAKYSNPSALESEGESTDVDLDRYSDSIATTEAYETEDDEAVSSAFVESEDTNFAEDQQQQSSLATLLQSFAPERAGDDDADDELNSVAALAESFQPKGYTLSSTSVATKVPFLLKHTLREYQHIGLDWLVTMHDKRLNGILADEMGLGKTIQTIALLAHLACEKGNWGPHLIIVPTSVMLNWEMEFLKWVPGLKVLTYYGSIKERKLKRIGWTKPNTFHVCITSYKILIQDHAAFRRQRWKYLILDEAQNIKNFKSQRWQLLLNFSTQRRLLLTGTPLQNNLMELWSLMHFLMPNVFQSHREFRQWFSNPMTGMIEGNSEYDENIIKRLHKVLRPFILRRLKSEVEKQLPQKYEHVVLCRLSKRQRFLYEDFMSRAKTKETLQTGSLLSVINVLMQLRKVCNHPNLFEPRPIISPLQTNGFPYQIPSLVWNMGDDEDEKTISYNLWNLTRNELTLDKQTAKKIRSLVSKNYRLTVRHLKGNPVMESISFPTKVSRMDNFRTLIDLNHKTDLDIVIPTDGDEDCSIIFEHKSDPSTIRKKMYTFQKSIVPNPPRLRTPFALFTTDREPSDELTEDVEFLDGIRRSLPDGSGPRIQSKPTFAGHADILEMVSPVKSYVRSSRRVSRVTKLSSSEYPMKLATTPNGSAVIVTSNGVSVVKPVPVQKVLTTTIPYTALGPRRGKLAEMEGKPSLLDSIVVDLEDAPEPELTPAYSPNSISPRKEIVPSAKRNGVEDDDCVILDDSDEGGGAEEIPTKIQRLEGSPDKRRLRELKAPPQYLEELDEQVGSPRSSQLKRKQSVTRDMTTAKLRKLDLVNINFEEVVYRRLCDRKAVISNLRTVNNRRLLVHTIYGGDLLQQVECLGVMPKLRYYQKQPNGQALRIVSARPEEGDHSSKGYFELGYHEVMLVRRLKTALNKFEVCHPLSVWRHTRGLFDLIWTLTDVTGLLGEILKRFIIYTPAVASPRIESRVFHPSTSRYTQIHTMEEDLSLQMKKPLDPLRSILSSMATQFPDPRLIQYDCGKLQVLDGLLRRLNLECHRVLIFTQMSKMLDILEAFLNHHGYIYLRLDGATKIDQRQLLMERFNTDRRIFCFILSTRSGGIGVNLTGADTVIFYDSDWNPTMDAQAQDRCHRIGQTRDVHIYRLVSEKTVEENILKKSNQKKLLGELAIEGGNFTTAYFKKNTIHDIFDVDEGEGDAKKRMAEILETPIASPLPTENQATLGVTKEQTESSANKYIFESALAAAEDDFDVQAARTVTAEAAAELAEFDEDIPLQDEEGIEVAEPSQIDQEMDYIMSELSSVELYALRFMETTIDDWSKDTFANVQRELEIQKLEWEQEQQQQSQNEAIFGIPSPEILLSVEEQLEDLITYPMVPQVTTNTKPPPASTKPQKSRKKRRRIGSGQARRRKARRRATT